MHQRQLGTNGPMVGAVGLGCMSFAGAYGFADPVQCHRVLARAAEVGITHLDTANIYGMGRTEEIVGDWIRTRRSQFVISSKAGIVVGPPRGFSNEAAYLRAELEASLKRLQTDHIDLYYIHRREPGRPVAEIVEPLARFVEEGKIGGFGFSEIAPSTLEEAAALHPVRAVQSEYSLWTRQPELGLIQACKRVGAAFVPFSPLARGMIGDVPLEVEALPEDEFRRQMPRFNEPHLTANRAYFARFVELARQMGHSPAALAIAWTMRLGDHIIPIPGTNKVGHLEQDALAADLVLSDSDVAAIEAVLPAGFAHGSRYSAQQWVGVEDYC